MIDELEPLAAAGGLVLDWHTCDAYPERWIDLVVVLQCDHTELWDRLEKRYILLEPVPLPASFPRLNAHFFLSFRRNYPLKKIQENNECEIMGTVVEEAREAYPEEIVVTLKSETPEDIDSNVERIIQWINNWVANNAAS